MKATGYKGWWCSETFCRKIQHENSYEIAAQMKSQLATLILNDSSKLVGVANGTK